MGAKVLYICQEITPYLPESDMSVLCRYLPQSIQERGCEIRTFMPRFGCVNERRNQLHEVIRLSGMNIIIDDNDHPLIIKVASIQAARMQVYFIDNEDFFRRKFTTTDAEGKEFDDNVERSIFFARGVLETVRKLRWVPDVIHCHGWMSSLVPLYVKKAYADDPHFKNAKVVYSYYDEAFQKVFKNSLEKKLIINEMTPADFPELKNKVDYPSLMKVAAHYSDGLIQGCESVSKQMEKVVSESGKPFIIGSQENDYENYYDFYNTLLDQK